ncbi:alpha-2-macroglobulin-like protein 1 [Alligator mississippiensis]|uniref:alpha-2-macroglobulin-like protein 1 n=1 Tax=Alligator mississippiensis TaxID=8496 RepID=UPI000711D4DF|nr:alpha-2-macroglobulin-like protein 1 [Alligator mississippiensis]
METPPTSACLIFLILHLAAGTFAKPQYVVVFPAELYHSHTGMVSVHLAKLSKTVQVIIQLQRKSEPSNITLLKRVVQEFHLQETVPFPVPAPATGGEEVAHLHVSIEGDSLKFSERKKVLLKALEPGTFVQTDKPIYKPGQTVKFRVVSLDKDFVPSNKEVTLVTLQDPNGNRIAQWRDVAPQQGIVDLSLPLPTEPALGTYSINVEDTKHFFSVEECVLPKFEVTIELPPVLKVLDDELQVRVCGRYTYGKPVLGKVQISLCRHRLQYQWPQIHLTEDPSREPCIEFDSQTEKNGCFSLKLGTAPFSLTYSGYQMSLEAKASLQEDGTGVEHNATKSCKIVSDVATLTFEDADTFYKPGIPYTGKMFLQDAGGSALKNEELQLLITAEAVSKTQTGKFKEVVHTHQEGRIFPRYPETIHLLKPFYSESRSFLKIRAPGGVMPCDQTQQLQVDYIIARTAMGDDSKSLDFIFLVVAKGAIIRSLWKGLDFGEGAELKGSFSIELPVGAELSPSAKVLGYTVLPNGEMAADSTELHMTKCFPNTVKLAFSEGRALPGSQLNLQVQAAPGSLCAVRAVDQSVLLMKPETELSTDTVYNLLPKFPEDYPIAAQDSPDCPERRWRHMWLRKRDHLWFNSYFLFQDAALKLITNANSVHSCKTEVQTLHTDNFEKETFMVFHNQAVSVYFFMLSKTTEVLDVNHVLVSNSEEKTAMRTYFPETWLWDLVPVGEGGSKDFPVTIPDTITEWKAGMFCTAGVGFGLSPMATLTAFKPFFVELALPYSVIRGEAFTLKATVFNYLLQCIKVQVTLVKSTQFQVQAVGESAYTSCLCENEGKTFQWEVTATSLGEVNFTISTKALHTEELCHNEVVVVPTQGQVDTVIKPLLVQPGGILNEKAHSSLLCQEASDKVSLEVPGNIVAGSEQAHMTVLGDMMGTALQNIDHLLAMPYGCGEQNMVRFAPNIYIQQYLEKSGQLTPEIRDKAQGFLRSGYQRELTFKHDDGSYSAFGKSDATGNTWLTAFVLKCFGQARPYIFIDQEHIEDALRWLQQHQLESGCFQSVGKLLNNALQGGISDEISLSAYITAALLELGQALTDPMVSKALQCLRKSSSTSDIYTQALLAYSFGMAGDAELRNALLTSLARHSAGTGGQLHWERKVKPSPGTESSWAQALSAEVEMTAYVLLAYLSPPKVSTADLATASQIVRWLSKQQNPYGGFASTQDTVVALQALAKYAALTYSTSGDMTVTVKSQGSFQQEFHVDNTNRLVLQQATLPQIPGEYTVTTHGQGCVLVQLTLRYNLPPPNSAATFDLRVETDPRKCTGSARAGFNLILHTRYSGGRSATNMAILEVKLPSGYIPDKKSVKKLMQHYLMKRLEVQKDQVILYLDELTKATVSFTFSLKQDFLVKNLKPAAVRLYDYYEKGEHAEADYSAPCS